MEQWRIDCVAVVVLATVLVLTIGQSAASPPVITLGLTDEGGIANCAATFYCKATGDPAPTFEWYRNTSSVRRQRRYQIVHTEGGSVLRISPLQLDRDNDQSVVCEASNDDGTATTQARLNVTQADSLPAGYPEITSSPRLMVVQKDRPATIYCGATGNPEPEILWFKEFVPIETNDRISMTDSGLQFSRTQLSDQGRYECAAKNSLGTRYSVQAQFYVKDRQVEPRFTILPVNQEVVPGGSVNLTCAAYGSPMPRVQWMKAGMDLDDMDDLPIGRNVLQLRDIYESANYTCVATSLLGTIDTSARVTVRIVCPVVTATVPDDLEQKICDSDNIFIVKVRPDGRAKILNDLTYSTNLYAHDRPIIGFITNNVCNVELTDERYMLFMAGEAVNVPGKQFTLDHTVLAMPMTGGLKVKVKETRPLCPVA